MCACMHVHVSLHVKNILFINALEYDVDELKQLLEEEQARVAQVCMCVRACMYM